MWFGGHIISESFWHCQSMTAFADGLFLKGYNHFADPVAVSDWSELG
jgi:hypothetical protein